jgi:hypothetical protein
MFFDAAGMHVKEDRICRMHFPVWKYCWGEKVQTGLPGQKLPYLAWAAWAPMLWRLWHAVEWEV